jgi:pilus assembly protein TadC
MTAAVAISAAAIGGCLLLVAPGHSADRRVLRIMPVRSSVDAVRKQSDGLAARRAVVALAAVAVALVLGGVVGLAVGGIAAVVLWRFLATLEPASRRRHQQLIERDLPVTLDLLSACLSAGTSVPDAVHAVAESLGDPMQSELLPVLSALELGVTPADAWQTLPAPSFGSVGRALARATTSGAPLADIVAALADERRDALQASAMTAARKAGVAAVGPLGLCFLPAFVCTAVIPVVAGLMLHVLQ